MTTRRTWRRTPRPKLPIVSADDTERPGREPRRDHWRHRDAWARAVRAWKHPLREGVSGMLGGGAGGAGIATTYHLPWGWGVLIGAGCAVGGAALPPVAVYGGSWVAAGGRNIRERLGRIESGLVQIHQAPRPSPAEILTVENKEKANTLGLLYMRSQEITQRAKKTDGPTDEDIKELQEWLEGCQKAVVGMSGTAAGARLMMHQTDFIVGVPEWAQAFGNSWKEAVRCRDWIKGEMGRLGEPVESQ